MLSINKESNLKSINTVEKSSIIITTIIISYNHEKYIEKAIESAVQQQGHFIHEILISDDFSSDNTQQIINKYEKKYPDLIKNVSNKKNIGISSNIKKCFSLANGKYVAILEGDDYWTDNRKLEKQMMFLEQNKDCSMCFSRVKFLGISGETTLSDIQNNLPNKFTGQTIIECKDLSVIINLSTCMFISKYMKNLPNVLYRYRFSEVSLQFYLEQKGKIGFISTPLSVYRQNKNGCWTGANITDKLKQRYLVRKNAYAICASKYKKSIGKFLREEHKKYILNKYFYFFKKFWYSKNFNYKEKEIQ